MQKEVKKEFKHFTTKMQLNTKEDSSVGSEGQKKYKAYRKQIRECQKSQTRQSKRLPKWIKKNMTDPLYIQRHKIG